jgi:hypothetical protein
LRETEKKVFASFFKKKRLLSVYLQKDHPLFGMSRFRCSRDAEWWRSDAVDETNNAKTKLPQLPGAAGSRRRCAGSLS